MASPNTQAGDPSTDAPTGMPRGGRQASPSRRPRSGRSAPAHQRPAHDPNPNPNNLNPNPNPTPKEDWRRWPQVSVRLRGLPAVTVQDIHTEFSVYGNIIYIEHFEDRQGKPAGEARIRFEPPPQNAFWSNGRYVFVRVGLDPARASAPVRIELDPPLSLHGAIRSTVNSRLFYPARMNVSVGTLEFGPTGTAASKFMPKRLLTSRGGTDDPRRITFKADFRNKSLAIHFSMFVTPDPDLGKTPGENPTDKAVREYKIIIDLAHLRSASVVDLTDGNFLLTIPLRHPPAYYFKNNDIARSFEADRLLWTENDLWVRASHVLDDNDLPQDYSLGLLNQWDDPNFIDIGRWTAFRMRLDAPGPNFRDLMGALEDFNVEITHLDDASALDDRPCLLPRENEAVRNRPAKVDKPEPEDDWLSLMRSDPEISTAARFFPFPVQYQLEVCISRGILCEYALSLAFLDRLRALEPDRARWILEYFADRGKPVEDPMRVFESDEANYYYPNPVVPHYCAVVRRAVVTPTTVYLSSPAVEASNRVLRKYEHVRDRFLRVQFTDELTRGRISTRAKMELDHYVFKRVYLAMINGIRVGDRHYKFLAFGNSQIRECGAYFFCETDHLRCADMRAWMGDFNHIRVVAKFAARLGQCFSTTREIRSIRVPTVRLIPDIERGGHCFTDGVGKISPFLASMILEEMGLETGETPSAFQFRMGGCKGVLAVWPEARGMEVHVRRSQEKFKAVFNGLEIIRCARYAVATLNRQTITILSCLGVKSDVFLDLLQAQLRAYEKAMNDQYAAAVLLGRHVDENHTSLALRDLINWGFMHPDVQEPFVLTILQLWRVWSMKLLRDKARIVVDKSAFVLGCVDETATLRGHARASEGRTASRDVGLLPQIFLQIPDPENDRGHVVVRGVCVVGRNPSLHPGDIRVVEAVDAPRLRHLKNVVVFPSKGDVDVPSMLSGGDLDGDDFFVIWDPRLIPPQWNVRPMDHATPHPRALHRDVNAKDLSEFFVKYMRNDCLPLIATSHLANADYLDGGAAHPKCLELAKLHSKAVDYVKTGDPAELGRELRARKWPHFMGERRNKRAVYHSRTALGLIYDRVQDVPFSPLYEKRFDRRILERFALDADTLREARRLKSAYDTAMRRLMAQREVATEFEIWTGFPLSRPRVGNAYKHAEDIGRDAALLKQAFRDEVHRAVGGSHYDRVAPFVAAMYQVTAEEVSIALHRRREARAVAGDPLALPASGRDMRGMPLITFPWIYHWVLGRIATGRERRDLVTDSAFDLHAGVGLFDHGEAPRPGRHDEAAYPGPYDEPRRPGPHDEPRYPGARPGPLDEVPPGPHDGPRPGLHDEPTRPGPHDKPQGPGPHGEVHPGPHDGPHPGLHDGAPRPGPHDEAAYMGARPGPHDGPRPELHDEPTRPGPHDEPRRPGVHPGPLDGPRPGPHDEAVYPERHDKVPPGLYDESACPGRHDEAARLGRHDEAPPGPRPGPHDGPRPGLHDEAARPGPYDNAASLERHDEVPPGPHDKPRGPGLYDEVPPGPHDKPRHPRPHDGLRPGPHDEAPHPGPHDQPRPRPYNELARPGLYDEARLGPHDKPAVDVERDEAPRPGPRPGPHDQPRLRPYDELARPGLYDKAYPGPHDKPAADLERDKAPRPASHPGRHDQPRPRPHDEAPHPGLRGEPAADVERDEASYAGPRDEAPRSEPHDELATGEKAPRPGPFDKLMRAGLRDEPAAITKREEASRPGPHDKFMRPGLHDEPAAVAEREQAPHPGLYDELLRPGLYDEPATNAERDKTPRPGLYDKSARPELHDEPAADAEQDAGAPGVGIGASRIGTGASRVGTGAQSPASPQERDKAARPGPYDKLMRSGLHDEPTVDAERGAGAPRVAAGASRVGAGASRVGAGASWVATGAESPQERDPADDMSKIDFLKLPDGRLLHRGEVLHLFDSDSEDKDEDEDDEAVYAPQPTYRSGMDDEC